MKKRILAMLMCVSLTAGLFPASVAYATDISSEPEDVEYSDPACECGAEEGAAHAEDCTLYEAPDEPADPACDCNAEDGAAHAESCTLYEAPDEPADPACDCNAEEGAAHAEGCPLYEAPDEPADPACDCNAEEGAAHAESCPLYEAPEVPVVPACDCGAEEGAAHAESCPLFVAPEIPVVPACDCNAEEGAAHAEGCPLYVAPEVPVVPVCDCNAEEGAAHAESCPLYVAPEVPVVPVCDCGAEEGAAHAESCPLFVAPVTTAIAGECEHGDSGVTVLVSAPEGAFPAGTELTITPIVATTDEDEEDIKAMVDDAVAATHGGIIAVESEEALEVLEAAAQQTPANVAFDISFTYDGEKVQPAEGYEVDVTFQLAEDSEILTDAQELQVYHVESDEDGDYVADPIGDPVDVAPAEKTPMLGAIQMPNAINFQSNAQTITVKADSFSIYVVESMTSTSGQRVYSTYSCGRKGTTDESLIFRGTGSINDYYHNWQITGTAASSIATITAGRTGQNVKILVKGTGTVTVTHTYGPSDSDSTTESFALTIVTGKATIANKIPNTGCLDVKYTVSSSDVTGDYFYRWFHSNASGAASSIVPLTEPSLQDKYTTNTSAGINVAVDQGGKSWYIVKVYGSEANARNNTGALATSASFWVPYSNQLENGSFENPVNSTGTSGRLVQYDQDSSLYTLTPANVTNNRALWWRTTAPGTGTHNGKDIEILSTKRSGNTNHSEENTKANGFHVAKAYSGNQFAELNSEAYGTLYQDVLTAPGSEFNWSVRHRGRWGNDSMRVVIMSSLDAAAAVMNQSYIKALISRADKDGGTGNGSTMDYGKTFVSKKLTSGSSYSGGSGNSYSTSGHSYSYTNWKLHTSSSSYVVPSGQYLTRFFFAHESSSGAPENVDETTTGNLIDDVKCTSEASYKIDYYLNDLQNGSTEYGTAAPYNKITPNRIAYFSNYVLGKVECTYCSYNTDTKKMSVLEDGAILRLYFYTESISIEKKVAGVNDLSLLNDYKVQFNLYEGDNLTDVIATAEVTFDGRSYSGVDLFKDVKTNKIFGPKTTVTYTIEEVQPPRIEGYHLKSVNDPNMSDDNIVKEYTKKITAPNGLASATFTNEYQKEPETADLTILKTGWNGIDENQSFIFHIKGTDDNTEDIDLTVTVQGKNSVIIKDLPSGAYTVTEDINWSWRYTPKNGEVTQATQPIVLPFTETVTFVNVREKGQWLTGDAYFENKFGENYKKKNNEDD